MLNSAPIGEPAHSEKYPTQPPMSLMPGNSPLVDIPDDYCPTGTEQWYIIPSGNDAGKKLFYYDTVIGGDNLTEPKTTVVCVHGNPECSYSYRHVIQQLREKSHQAFRLVVMDHIGFGRSDQASYEMVDMHHADNLQQLVKFLDLQRVTLVIHDWGGPIGVGAFINEPWRVTQLVILNTTVFPLPLSGLTYENFPTSIKALSWAAGGKTISDTHWKTHAAFSIHATRKPLMKILGSYIGYCFKSFFNTLPSNHKVYRDMLSTKTNARSSKRMVRQTPVWGHGYTYRESKMGFQDNFGFYKNIQNKLSEAWGSKGQNIPTRLLFGGWDPLAKPSVIEQWLNALPQLEGHIQVFPNVSHFVAEHKSEEIAQAIVDVADLG
jgi:pimeloyl-ACP methyl ester carboxylesterase